MKNPQFLVIDLFCGAGGTTTGFEKSGTSKVIICVNHDANAIASHEANHPDCEHYVEDVRLVNIRAMLPTVEKYQRMYPDAKLILWASAECTNFSNAKGGCPRDADSRSLANDLERYVDILQPDYFMCENVREFMSWGELDPLTRKPISKKNGIFYMRWVKSIQRHGYEYDWRLLNSADFGAYQSRERYFGIFAKDGLPIRFPTATHCKKPQIGTLEYLEDRRKPHKAVKDVLELDNVGKSIFTRKKPLVDRTLTRILRGLQKFANETMIMRNNNPGYCRKLDKPIGTITTKDTNYLISPSFLKGYFGNPTNNPRIKSVNASAPTITTQSRYGVVSLQHRKQSFLYRFFGNEKQLSSIEKPCGAITAAETTALTTIKQQWISPFYSKGAPFISIEKPCGTLTTVDKNALTTAHFIVNPQFANVGSSINKPCPTVIALQGKKPLSLATAFYDATPDYLRPKDQDSEVMIELKLYCIEKGIADVYLRMLTVKELLQIQGFPKDYILKGTAEEVKKYIGNAVEVNMAAALATDLADANIFYNQSMAA